MKGIKMKRKNNQGLADPVSAELAEILSQPVPVTEPAPQEVLVTEAHYQVPQPEPVSEPVPEPEPVPTPEQVPVQVMALIQDLQNQILFLHSELKEAKGKVAALEAIFGGEAPDVFMTMVANGIMQEAKDALEKTKASVAETVVQKLRKYHRNPYAVNNPDF